MPFLSRWGPAIGLMLLIFLVSAQPSTRLPGLGAWDWLFTNGGHFVGYALLSIALLRGVRGRGTLSGGHLAGAFVLAILYALSDELHQAFVPGRMPDAWDVAVDAAGAMTGLGLRGWWTRRPRAAPYPNKSGSTRR